MAKFYIHLPECIVMPPNCIGITSCSYAAVFQLPPEYQAH